MKLSEINRLQLENIQLKRNLVENAFNNLQMQVAELTKEQNDIITKFCEEHNLDKEKININLQTGEVILQEEGDGNK